MDVVPTQNGNPRRKAVLVWFHASLKNLKIFDAMLKLTFYRNQKKSNIKSHYPC